ncbi:MAG: hypothetical protein JWR55_3293, partial [Aeromicrobium sp.]|nr:hypothetical protein [Aeromicrobium sp.]
TAVASAAAGGAAVFLVAVPAEDASSGRGALLTVSVLTALGAALLAGPGSWRRGGRALVGVLTAGLSLTVLGLLAELAEAAARGLESLRSTPLDARPTDVPGPWWLVVVLMTSLVVIVTGAGRWPETARAKRHLVPLPVVVAAVGIVLTVASAGPPFVVTAAALMAVSGGLALAIDRFGMPWQLAPVVGVALALGGGLSHAVASTILWTAGAVVLAGVSTRVADRFVRDVVVLLSAATTVGAVSFALDLAGVVGAGLALAYVVTAAALAAVALALRGRRGVPIEIVAGVTMLVGLVMAASGSAADVRAAIVAVASGLLLVLSLGAGRDADAWWTLDRPQGYRAGGVTVLLGAMLAGLPESDVCLAVWAWAALVLGVLSWRVRHPAERAVVTFLSPLAAVGALAFGLDLVAARPQAFALAFVAAAGLIVLAAGTLRGGRERPVEAAAGVALVLSLGWTADVPDPLWRALTWSAGGLLLIAASLLRYSWPRTDRAAVLRVAGTAVLIPAMLMPLPDAADSAGFWAGGAVVLALLSWRTPVRLESRLDAFVAAVAAAVGTGLVLEVADATTEASSVSLVATAAVLCAVGALENGARRLPVELAAAPTAATAVAIAIVSTPVSWVALVLTVLGALSVLLGLLGAGPGPYRRQAYRIVGATSLAVAYVLRLIASDVDLVEAYTLPFGVILLAAGAWTLRKDPSTSSLLALGPGLTLTLLPSLPQALAEPTGPRALLLGLAALIALVVGVSRTLQAPFLLGGVVFAVLVMVNLGPYAFALPRWTLIAGASALLLAVGITWEDRVRDGRAAAQFVAAMR